MADLKLNLVVRMLDGATAPLRRLGQQVSSLQRPFRALRMTAGGLGRDIGRLATIGAGFAVAASASLWSLTRRIADAGDAALEASERLGIGVVAFQRWSHAAKMSGSDAGGLETALKMLNLSIAGAAAGSRTDAAAFERLGLSATDAEGRMRPLEAMLPEIAEAFSQMAEGPEKAQVAMALFGRAGDAMIPMLNRGRDGIKALGDEAERLGILTKEQAEAAGYFNDSIDTLTKSIFGLGNGIGGSLLGPMTQLINQMTALIAANKPEVIRRLTAALKSVETALPGILQALGDLIGFLGFLAGVVVPVVRALGGLHQVLDMLALLMIGRVALAIWTAVSAVWGLNTAMAANPIGLIIIAIAAWLGMLYLLVRNWRSIANHLAKSWDVVRNAWSSAVSFFRGVFAALPAVFEAGVNMIWNKLPAWFRTLVRGGAFLVRTVVSATQPGGGSGGGVAASIDRPRPRAPGAPQPTERPSPAGRGRLEITVHDDRRTTVRTDAGSLGMDLARAGPAPLRSGR